MDNSLVMYPNLQFNPIEIPEFTLVEFYKESIAAQNGLGYCIIPIKGLSQEQIETEIRNKGTAVAHEGYTKFKVLSTGDFNHKIVYGVWYETDEPVYPQEPEIESLTPAAALNIWKEIEVENAAAPTYITVTLTCSSFVDTIEFYINKDYFAIDIKEPVDGVNIITITKDGVVYNGNPIDSFKMTSAPKLQAGANSIKVKTIGVTNIDIKYKNKF